MCFIARETRKFILKFGKIFSWRETVLRAHEMKPNEKPFFCQIYARKMVHVVSDRYFCLFLIRFEDRVVQTLYRGFLL